MRFRQSSALLWLGLEVRTPGPRGSGPASVALEASTGRVAQSGPLAERRMSLLAQAEATLGHNLRSMERTALYATLVHIIGGHPCPYRRP